MEEKKKVSPPHGFELGEASSERATKSLGESQQ